jgi:hypothetical protein
MVQIIDSPLSLLFKGRGRVQKNKCKRTVLLRQPLSKRQNPIVQLFVIFVQTFVSFVVKGFIIP